MFAADLVLSPAYHPAKGLVFARIGAVQPDSVKVHIRYPQENSTDGILLVKYRPAIHDGQEGEMWQNGPSIQVQAIDDWVGSAVLASLWPNTTYECEDACVYVHILTHIKVTLTDILTNSTSHALPYPVSPLRFKTFPDHRLQTGSFFRFVTSSCLKHNFPYSPGAGNRIEGFELLSDNLWPSPANAVQAESSYTATTIASNAQGDASSLEVDLSSAMQGEVPPTEFLLLLGDFIYADVPYYFGDDKEAYSRLYRHTYASPSFRKIYEKLRECFLMFLSLKHLSDRLS